MARGDIFTVDQLREQTGVQPVAPTSSEVLADTPLTEADRTSAPEASVGVDVEQESVAEDLAEGVLKSGGQTILGLGTLGRGIQRKISGVGEALFGEKNPFKLDEGNLFDSGEKREKFEELVTPESKAEKVGMFIGDVAQFAIPGSYASKATVGAGITRRMLAQGLTGATVQAAKSGDIGKDELAVGAMNALMVPVGDVLTKGISSLSTHFPEWLVRPLTKQSPSAKLKGKDAAQYLVESGRIGSVDSLIGQTDEAMTALNTQIDDIIAAKTGAGVTINRADIVANIVDDINAGGGAIDEAQVLGTINKLAPQARGLLGKETLTLAEANQLRKALDRTLGDRAFFANQLTFNKGVLMDFTNALRESVKSSDDALAPLYSEYAKNITLKQALNARAVAGGGANNIGMYDLLTGGAAFTATGNPVTALLAAGGRRAFETAPVKTTLAQVFKNTDKILPALDAASPAVRGAVLEFIASLSDDNTDKNR